MKCLLGLELGMRPTETFAGTYHNSSPSQFCFGHLSFTGMNDKDIFFLIETLLANMSRETKSGAIILFQFCNLTCLGWEVFYLSDFLKIWNICSYIMLWPRSEYGIHESIFTHNLTVFSYDNFPCNSIWLACLWSCHMEFHPLNDSKVFKSHISELQIRSYHLFHICYSSGKMVILEQTRHCLVR